MVEKHIGREAVIDLGTNTFNLLVGEIVDGQLNIIHSSKIPVLLGMGGINQGVIAGPAMTRAKDALNLFNREALDYGAKRIRGIGTSALRDASNSQELVDYAREKLKLEIEIVSGDREAELIYLGVCRSYDFSSPAVIMDIGGGSTEFIAADQHGCDWSSSLDIGVSRMYQLLDEPEEFTPEHIAQTIAFFEEQAGTTFQGRSAKTLIGASGSFETLYEMVFKKAFPSTGQTLSIPIDELNTTLDWAIESSLAERESNDWIVPMRKKMLPIAAIKVKWVMKQLGIEEVLVTPYSLKEGVFSTKTDIS